MAAQLGGSASSGPNTYYKIYITLNIYQIYAHISSHGSTTGRQCKHRTIAAHNNVYGLNGSRSESRFLLILVFERRILPFLKDAQCYLKSRRPLKNIPRPGSESTPSALPPAKLCLSHNGSQRIPPPPPPRYTRWLKVK